MKRIAFIIIITLTNINIYSQNLVKNPCFENLKSSIWSESECADEFNKYVSDWQSLAFISAEIFKYDSTFLKSGNDSLYFNALPTPNSGCNMAGIFTYGINRINEPYRSYIQGQLIKPLIKGNKYNISFSIALPDFRGAISISNNIGVYFSKKKLPIVKESTLHYKPQLNYTEIPPIKNPKEWITISWKYTAQDTFKYFTIGNFFNNEDTKFRNTNKKPYAAEFIIDDVKIEEINHEDTIKGQQ